MQKVLVRSGVSLLLFAMGVSFMWYGVLTNRIAAEDHKFVLNHAYSRFFPEALYWSGKTLYYSRKDAASAIRKYGEAIVRQPLFVDAWFELIKANLHNDNMAEAHRIFLALAPVLTHTNYWKWKELLLSYDLKEDGYFDEAFNSILAKSPERIGDACKVGLLKWGGWNGVIAHSNPENLPALMKPLFDTKSIEDIISLWNRMKGTEIKDKNLLLRVCDFAMEKGRVAEAKEMWNEWLGKKYAGIYDGNFDEQPTNSGFGWCFRQHPQVQTEYSSLELGGPGRSLHFRFMGTENIFYNHVSQVVPVEPGEKYTLTFSRKSRNIDTDQGIYIKVIGFKCESPQARSTPVIGTNPWSVEEISISVPNSCEAVLVQVCRDESLKLDNKISGDYWLGGLSLKQTD